MNKTLITLACLSLMASYAYSETTYPKHIVKPLEKEADPSQAGPFQPNEQIAKSLNEKEKTQLAQDTAPFDTVDIRNKAQKAFDESMADNAKTDKEVADFIKNKNVPLSINTTVNEEKTEVSATDSKEEDGQASDATTTIRSSDGFYFDSETGLLVYMGNVTVDDPRFTLKCTGPLRVYLRENEQLNKKDKNKPEETETKENKEDKVNLAIPGNGEFKYNDLDKITADGDVDITYIKTAMEKNKQGKEVEVKTVYHAKCDKMTYDPKTGETLLYGHPYFSNNTSIMMEGSKPNAFIRVYKNMNAFGSGVDRTEIKGIKNIDKTSKDKKK